MLRHIDARLGSVISDLKEDDMYADTLIVITAPHGETLADDRAYSRGHPFGHLYNHEEILHVPLIIKPPGGSAVGVVREPVELIDIYPTVLDWAGITVPDAVQGTSIRPPHDRDGRYAFSGDGADQERELEVHALRVLSPGRTSAV